MAGGGAVINVLLAWEALYPYIQDLLVRLLGFRFCSAFVSALPLGVGVYNLRALTVNLNLYNPCAGPLPYLYLRLHREYRGLDNLNEVVVYISV